MVEAVEVNTCWSCLAILPPGTKECPYCGADQTLPEVRVILEPEEERKGPLIVLRWALVALAVVGSLGGLLSYMMREPAADSPEVVEATAGKTLLDLRTSLSQYAMRSGDKYPEALDSLGGRTATLLRAAEAAGYTIRYVAHPSEKGGGIQSYVILARIEKTGYRNFYIDESGVLRATEESREANSKDAPY